VKRGIAVNCGVKIEALTTANLLRLCGED
jgi:hypothetical protein